MRSRRTATLALCLLGIVAFASPAAAGLIGSVVAYGDSLSDNGNLYAVSGSPPAPYWNGRFSNGPVAVEQLAQHFGVPLYDFAFGGATTGIGNYADGGTPTSMGSAGLPGMRLELLGSEGLLSPLLAQGLFIVWGGANDVFGALDSGLLLQPGGSQAVITQAVGDLGFIVSTLQGLGAQTILVPDMPDLGLTPLFASIGLQAFGSTFTDDFNAALRSSLPAGVLNMDTAALLRGIVANPGAYGLTNVTDPCFNGVSVCSDASQYLFWDSVHPTTAGAAILASSMEGQVPEPGTVSVVAGLAVLLALRIRRTARN